MAVLEISGLTKEFPLSGSDPLKVLKGIDLDMDMGEFFTLMGPSGSGKSTMLNIIGALIPATGGSVKVDGIELTELNDNKLTDMRRSEIGWVFQDFNLIANLNALENVMIPMNLAGKVGPEAEERARELLEIMGLGDRMDHFPDGLSGGQQQRVAIARALANDPKILLADEPTGNLDTSTGREIIELFKELAAQGKVILMVTHDIALAHAAQKVFILRDGRVEEEQEQEVII